MHIFRWWVLEISDIPRSRQFVVTCVIPFLEGRRFEAVLFFLFFLLNLLLLLLLLLLALHPACTTGTQSAGSTSADLRYVFPFDPVLAPGTLTNVNGIAKSGWDFSSIDPSLATSTRHDPVLGVRVSFSLRGDGVTTHRVRAMKHLKGAIEEDAHHKQDKAVSASRTNFGIEAIAVEDDPSTAATSISFTITADTEADANALLEVFAVPTKWEKTINKFQARELWKETVSELAVKCFIPIENIMLENINTDIVVMQMLTVAHNVAFKLTTAKRRSRL